MTPLSVLLATAAACVLLNIWLGMRIARLRRDLKVSVGDGGHDLLLRRMRAQANFIENAPFVLILLGGLELCFVNPAYLAVIAGIFVLARIAHAIGMDAPELRRWRASGMIATSLVNLTLAVWALYVASLSSLGR
jgi:uncharacterized protein